MRNLRPFLRKAQGALMLAREDLSSATKDHAYRKPASALLLVQLTMGVSAAYDRLPEHVTTPIMPDLWILAAASLHETILQASEAVVGLLEGAERERIRTPVPESAFYQPEDLDLFGRSPADNGLTGWTGRTDVWGLQDLDLPTGSRAWERRADIVAAADVWADDYRTALDASGVKLLREAGNSLATVLKQLRHAIGEVDGSTVAAARALAKVAARSLVEIGDDPEDLLGLTRSYAREHMDDPPVALVFLASASLLAASRKSMRMREVEKI